MATSNTINRPNGVLYTKNLQDVSAEVVMTPYSEVADRKCFKVFGESTHFDGSSLKTWYANLSMKICAKKITLRNSEFFQGLRTSVNPIFDVFL